MGEELIVHNFPKLVNFFESRSNFKHIKISSYLGTLIRNDIEIPITNLPDGKGKW